MINTHLNDVVFTRDSLNKFIKLIKTEGIKNLDYYVMSSDIDIKNILGDEEFSLGEKTFFNGNIAIVNKSYYYSNPYKEFNITKKDNNNKWVNNLDSYSQYKDILKYNLINIFNFDENSFQVIDNQYPIEITISDDYPSEENNITKVKGQFDITLVLNNQYRFIVDKKNKTFTYGLSPIFMTQSQQAKQYTFIKKEGTVYQYQNDKNSNNNNNNEWERDYNKTLSDIPYEFYEFYQREEKKFKDFSNNEINNNNNCINISNILETDISNLYYKGLKSITYDGFTGSDSNKNIDIFTDNNGSQDWKEDIYKTTSSDPLYNAFKNEYITDIEENNFDGTIPENYWEIFFADTSDHKLSAISLKNGYTNANESAANEYGLYYNKSIPVKSIKIQSWEQLKLIGDRQLFPNIENKKVSKFNTNGVSSGKWQPSDLIHLFSNYQILKQEEEDIKTGGAASAYTIKDEESSSSTSNAHNIVFNDWKLSATEMFSRSDTSLKSYNEFEYIVLDNIDPTISLPSMTSGATNNNAQVALTVDNNNKTIIYYWAKERENNAKVPLSSATKSTTVTISNSKIDFGFDADSLSYTAGNAKQNYSITYTPKVNTIVLKINFNTTDQGANQDQINVDTKLNFEPISTSSANNAKIEGIISTDITYTITTSKQITKANIPIYILPLNNFFKSITTTSTNYPSDILNDTYYGLFMQKQYDDIDRYDKVVVSGEVNEDNYNSYYIRNGEEYVTPSSFSADSTYYKHITHDENYYLIGYQKKNWFWESDLYDSKNEEKDREAGRLLLQDRFNNSINNALLLDIEKATDYTTLNKDLHIFDISLSSGTSTTSPQISTGPNNFYDGDLGFYCKSNMASTREAVYQLQYTPNVIDTTSVTYKSIYNPFTVDIQNNEDSVYNNNIIPQSYSISDEVVTASNDTIKYDILYSSSFTAAPAITRASWESTTCNYGTVYSTTYKSTVDHSRGNNYTESLFLYTKNENVNDKKEYEQLEFTNNQYSFANFNSGLTTSNIASTINDILTTYCYYQSISNNESDDLKYPPQNIIRNNTNDNIVNNKQIIEIIEIDNNNDEIIKYLNANVTTVINANDYQPNKYYYYDNNTKKHVLATEDEFQENRTYFSITYQENVDNEVRGTKIYPIENTSNDILIRIKNEYRYTDKTEIISIEEGKYYILNSNSSKEEIIIKNDGYYSRNGGEKLLSFDNPAFIIYLDNNNQVNVLDNVIGLPDLDNIGEFIRLPYTYKIISARFINDSNIKESEGWTVNIPYSIFIPKNKEEEQYTLVEPLTKLDPNTEYFVRNYTPTTTPTIKQIFETDLGVETYYTWAPEPVYGKECDGSFSVKMSLNNNVVPDDQGYEWLYGKNNDVRKINSIQFTVSTTASKVKTKITPFYDYFSTTAAKAVFTSNSYNTTKAYQDLDTVLKMTITGKTRTALVQELNHTNGIRLLSTSSDSVPSVCKFNKLLNRTNIFDKSYTNMTKDYWHKEDSLSNQKGVNSCTSNSLHYQNNTGTIISDINFFDLKKQMMGEGTVTSVQYLNAKTLSTTTTNSITATAANNNILNTIVDYLNIKSHTSINMISLDDSPYLLNSGTTTNTEGVIRYLDTKDHNYNVVENQNKEIQMEEDQTIINYKNPFQSNAWLMLVRSQSNSANYAGYATYLCLQPEEYLINSTQCYIYALYTVNYNKTGTITNITIDDQHFIYCQPNKNNNPYSRSLNGEIDGNVISNIWRPKDPSFHKGIQKIYEAYHQITNYWFCNPYPAGEPVFFENWCKSGKNLESKYDSKNTAERTYYYYSIKLPNELSIALDETYYQYKYNFNMRKNGTKLFADDKKDHYLVTYSLIKNKSPQDEGKKEDNSLQPSESSKGYKLDEFTTALFTTISNTSIANKYYYYECDPSEDLSVDKHKDMTKNIIDNTSDITMYYSTNTSNTYQSPLYIKLQESIADTDNTNDTDDIITINKINRKYYEYDSMDPDNPVQKNSGDPTKLTGILIYNIYITKTKDADDTENEEDIKYELYNLKPEFINLNNDIDSDGNHFELYKLKYVLNYSLPEDLKNTYSFTIPFEYSIDSDNKITPSLYLEDFSRNYGFRHTFLNIPNKKYTNSYTGDNPFPNAEYYLNKDGCLVDKQGNDQSPKGTFSISSGTLEPGVLVQVRGFNDLGEFTGDLNGGTLNNVTWGDGILHIKDTSDAWRKPIIDVINAKLKVRPENEGGNIYASIVTEGGISAAKKIKGERLYGAIWNDYAEYRETDNIEPGRCVIETGTGRMRLSTERLQGGANITSDTFGMGVGETAIAKTPIAVSGRVLAYPYEDKNIFKPGDAVCSGPNGTVSIMTRDEIKEWPDRIVGYVSEIPHYETWGTGNVQINGRIWIKVH